MLLDTNVLVRARFEAAPRHGFALRWMRQVGESGEALRISRQVMREYLATVTRPQPWSPPVAMDAALSHVASLEAHFEILEDGPGVAEILTRLCREVPVAGKQVQDANIVATMLAHGERRLLTFNESDFRRYGERIALMDIERTP
jgi:predicted nucleic acid-binding protein